MIRLVFDNSKLVGSPQVYRDGEEVTNIRSVTIFPGRVCVVETIDQPAHLKAAGEVATSTFEGDYQVGEVSAS